MRLDRDRAKAGAGAAALHLGLLYALMTGLAVTFPAPSEVRRLVALSALPPPEPPPPVEVRLTRQSREVREENGGAPPNIRSRPTEIVLPPPVVPLLIPPPVVAAPFAGQGSDPSLGDAEIRGPGWGRGGEGTGTGTGRGPGSGDLDGGGTPPRRIRGRISDRDYPRGLGEAGISGTVSVEYRVQVDGRATDCVVTESSGSRELDETTCRLIEQRFRFAPSRDRYGRPVRSIIVEDHSWMVEDEPEEREGR